MSANSEPAFIAALEEHDLLAIQKKFLDHGYNTFSNFSFSCWNASGQSNEKFDSEVLPKLAKESDTEERKLIPRIRKLYSLAWVHTQAGMEHEANVRQEDKVTMPAADFNDRFK